MKRSHLLTMILSLSLVICIVAGSIDWSFLGANASMEELVEDPDENVTEEETVDGATEDKTSDEEMPAAEDKVSEEEMPAEDTTPDKEVPAEDKTPAEEVPAEDKTSDEEVPAVEDKTTAEEMPAVEDKTSAEEVPAKDKIPAEEVPVEDTTQNENVPVEDKMVVEEVPANNDLVKSLSVATDGFSAVYFRESGFASDSKASLSRLDTVKAEALASDLSKTLEGRTVVPVAGFEMNVLSDGLSKDDVLNVELSGKINTDAKLYRYQDGLFSSAGYTVKESGIVTFQSSMPATYLFVTMEYDEKPLTFTYSDNDVTVTAVCAAKSGIPADAKFQVKKLEKDSEAYQEAYDALLSTMELAEGDTLVFAPYDVSFVQDGKEIEPVNGTVQVSMEFSDNPLETDSEDEVPGDVFCVHIKDNGKVEELNAAVSEFSITFEVDSFSVMAVAAVSRAAATPAYAILYSDETLVFQRGNTPDSSHGTVKQTYSGIETADYSSRTQVPWYRDQSYKTIKSVIVKDRIKPVSLRYWFYDFYSCTSIDLTKLDTSSVTRMDNMFEGCSKIESLDLSNFNTRSVTNMRYMFYRCYKLKSLDISNFNTHFVTDMHGMFNYCKVLKSLDLRHFDTSSVTDMHGMFDMCYELEFVDLSSFDTSSVTDMASMFYDCKMLKSVDLSSFNTKSITSMSQMFTDCGQLKELDLSNFDGKLIISGYRTFDGCSSLEFLNLSNFDTRSLTDTNLMFRNVNKLTTVILGSETKNKSVFDFPVFQTNWICKETGNVCNLFDSYTGDHMAGTYVKQCDITFDSVYGGKQTISSGLGVIINDLPVSPVISNRHFDGWFTERTGGKQLLPGDTIEQTTYYAHWTNYISITFDSVYGNKQLVTSYIGATIDELPDAPDVKNRYFDGWFTEKLGGKQLLPGGTIESSTYYAHWTDYRYNLVLKPNGGDGEDLTGSHSYFEFIKLPGAVFNWPGKEFTGWNTRKDGSGQSYAPTDSVRGLSSDDGGTVVLYAQYKDPEDLVTVTFETNGGLAVPSVTVVRGSKISLPTPVKDGYTFDGWSEDKTGTDSFQTIGTLIEITDNITYYAQWKKNPVVTFDTQGMGFIDQQREVSYNGIVGSLPEYPSSSNRYMSLIGWFTEANGGTQISSTTRVTEDTTFYAHWGWKPRFDTAGGKITSDETFSIQDGSSVYAISTLPTAMRDGYTFDGWYLGDEKLSDGCSIDLSKGIDIIAHWTERDVVTVTFNANGGRVNGSSTSFVLNCFKNDSLTAFPSATGPSKYISGFGTTYASFLGWMDESGKYYTEEDVFTEDITLTAQWQDRDILLTFDADGGSSISGTGVTSSKMCVPAGTTLFTLPGTKKTNYILEGWYTEKNGAGEKLTTDTVIMEARTYYANWTPFFLNGSDASSLYVYGAEWSNASNSNMTNLDNVLEMHPSSTSSQTASLHIRFELNRSIESGEDLVLPVGAVKIRIPKYIWKDWDGNNTGSNNLSANLPKYPAVRNGMWFSYMEDGDDYVLINSKELSGTAGLDLTIGYTVSPANVPGGASDANGCYLPEYEFYKGDVPVRFSVDGDLDGITESEMTRELSVEMHTTARLTGTKSYNNIYYKWNSSWGQEPDDADKYFYVRWYINSNQSGIQSISDISFSENLVHDGTVVTTSFASYKAIYVITKHPLSLLANAPSTGLTLKNTASIHGVMRSGCPVSLPVTASTVIHNAVYSSGNYSKQNYNSNNSVYTVNGGQEFILDDEKDTNLPWHLNYSGGSDTVPVWNEDSGTYSAKERTIRIKDGVYGDVMYSSGTASSKYVWEPNTGNILLNDSDYYYSRLSIILTEYDADCKDGVWTSPYVNSNQSAWNGFDVYVRYAGSDNFVFYNYYPTKANQTTTIYFNETNIVGFDVRHNTDYYSTYISIGADMKLRPTTHVKTLLQDDVNVKASSIIKNSATCDVWTTALGESSTFFHAVDNTGGNNAANKNCYELNVSRTLQYVVKDAASQSSVIFDVMKGTQDSPICINSHNYNNGGRKKKMNAGIFYDLLPEGTSVDPDTVFGIPIVSNNRNMSGVPNNYNLLKNDKDRIDRGYYDVRFIQNWEDSGRTMMIIKYGLPESYQLTTGMRFYYLLHNTYENVMEHGTTVENDVAFVDLTENRTPPYSISGSLSTITQKMYYQSLEDVNTGNIGYAKVNTNYIPVDAYSWGFNKSVQTVSEYEYQGNVLPNTTYTYRLVYSQSEYATSRDLVFFDVLEGGSDTKGEDGQVQHNESGWHGILQYVNTGAASSKLTDGSTTVHCKPVIYYSTKDRAAFTGSDWDVTNTETWTTVKPADVQTITAVAIDCSKNEDGSNFVMKGKQSLEMYITMKAPVGAENVGKTAYNEGVIWARHENDDDATPEYDNAAVTIQDVDPEIHKSSWPESGTQESPADVYEDDELSYTISVKNGSDTFTLNDIIVEDTIPEGLSLDVPNIKVHFGNPDNAIGISTSPRVSMQRTGRNLKFTVSSLLPEETMYLEISAVVLVDHGILSNTARITSMNGVAKTVESETTWHEAQPTGMAVRKTGVGGLAIPGARMQLLDMDENVLHEWISTEHTEHFEVKPGDYVIHEVEAPEGYLIADDIAVNLSRTSELTLKSDGTVVSPAVMVDDWTKVVIRKQNPEGELLPGAVLALYSADDVTDGVPTDGSEPVDRWTTDEEAHEFMGVLGAGKSYVLIEESAPERYLIAEPVTFTVATDGSEQTIIMTDPRDGTEVTLRKADADDNLLKGAELSLYKVKEGSDEPDDTFETVTWTSSDTENQTLRLEPGDYVMHEISAPAGYAVADDIRFTVTTDNKVLIGDTESPVITMTDFYEEHELSVVKRVKGNMGDRTQAFRFRLTLTASGPAGLPDEIVLGRYTDDQLTGTETVKLTDGACEFELSHGDRISVVLPYGTEYEVTELNGEELGYAVSSLSATSTVTDHNIAVEFTNTKNGGIPTGFGAYTAIALMFITVSGMIVLLLIRRRKK